MITFPPEFVTTKFPGYFWNTKTCRLYSIKISGELHEHCHTKASRWTNHISGYRVSVKGVRRWLTDNYLKKLTSQEISIVYK